MRPLAVLIAAACLGCATSSSQIDDASAVRSNVFVQRSAVNIHEGSFVTRIRFEPEAPLDLIRALYATAPQLRSVLGDDWQPVVEADDDADALVVMGVIGGLQRDCDQPSHARLDVSMPPAPLAPITFHACHAQTPVRYCSKASIAISAPQIELTRRAAVLGVDCPLGAKAFLPSSMSGARPPVPPQPEPLHAVFARDRGIDTVIDALHEPHDGLAPCSDMHVGFEGDLPWSEARQTLAALQRTGARMIVDVQPLD